MVENLTLKGRDQTDRVRVNPIHISRRTQFDISLDTLYTHPERPAFDDARFDADIGFDNINFVRINRERTVAILQIEIFEFLTYCFSSTSKNVLLILQ